MKIKPIEKIIKASKKLAVKKSPDGTTWLGDGKSMYNVGDMATSDPLKTIKWLFGIEEDIADYDVDLFRYQPPRDDDLGDGVPEGEIRFPAIGYKGVTIVPYLFSDVVFVLTEEQLAPLLNEGNVTYFYHTQTRRILAFRGIFVVASFEAFTLPADSEVVDRLEKLLLLVNSKGEERVSVK